MSTVTQRPNRRGSRYRRRHLLLYGDTPYPAGSLVLEAGCGTGAQTPVITKNSPGAVIISVDISQKSLEVAKNRTTAEGRAGEYLNCDIFGLPFPGDSFDHIFVCFVLEHLRDPVDALTALMRVLKPGGTITVIEGVGEDAVSSGMMTKEEWDEGISALYRTAEEDGTFCYTFFKATGTRPV
ncbi:class I SAM-dependent methyltransferase [Methanolacinia petrolearia]|uniref:class I SAM-dependent methyltransferase n=1 Tax=Methanolacinia petrolearia TaxID=54120 RepID=UPI003BA8618F